MSKTAKLADLIEDFSKGDSEKVISLLAEKANPNAEIPDGDGDTIFQYFIASMPRNNFKENMKVVLEFLKAGANPLTINDESESLMESLFGNDSLRDSEAVAIFKVLCRHIEVNRLKLKTISKSLHGIDKAMRGRTQINSAVRELCINFLKRKRKYKHLEGDLKRVAEKYNETRGVSDLSRSAYFGKTEGGHGKIATFLTKHHIKEENRDDRRHEGGMTLGMRNFVVRVKENQNLLEETRTYLSHGGRINAVDDNQESMLFYAARTNESPSLVHLINNGANLEQLNYKGETFLHAICESKNYRLLLNVFSPVMERGLWAILLHRVLPIANQEGMNVFHIVASHQADDVFRGLLDANQFGRTVTERRQYTYFLQNMLQGRNRQGLTPQQLIENKQIKGMIDLVLEREVEYTPRSVKAPVRPQNRVNFMGVNELIKLVKKLSPVEQTLTVDNRIRRMVTEDKIDVNTPDAHGNAPLLYALRNRLEKVSLLLMEYDPKLNVADNLGNTPIFYAVQYNLRKVMLQLLQSRVKMAGVCNKRGENILHIAARHNKAFYKMASKNPQLRELKNQKDNGGQTPEDIFGGKEKDHDFVF